MLRKFGFSLKRLWYKRWSPKISLSLVILNISDACNRSCYMCPRSQGYKHNPTLPMYMEEKTIENIGKGLGKEYDGVIALSGIGEPLLHPNIKNIIKQLKTLCPESHILIITNGDFLTNDIIKMPEVWFINISCYEEDNYYRLKEKYKNCNNIYLMEQYDEKHLDCPYNNRAGNAGPEAHLDLCCIMPFFQMMIDTDGRVYPCSSDWGREHPYGNINNENIYDIFINNMDDLRKDLLNKRRHLTPICKKCDGKGMNKRLMNLWKYYYTNKDDK